MSDISIEVIDLSKKLSQKITTGLDENNPTLGVAVIDEKAYIETLPEGISEEQVKSLQKHNSNFVAAAVHALGEGHAIEFFKKNKDAQSIEMTVPLVGKDSLSMTIAREKTYPGINGNADVTKYIQATTLKLDTYASKNSGQLKKVRDTLAQLGQKALAGN